MFQKWNEFLIWLIQIVIVLQLQMLFKYKNVKNSDADSHLGPPFFPLVSDGKNKTITIQLNVLLFQLHIYTLTHTDILEKRDKWLVRPTFFRI